MNNREIYIPAVDGTYAKNIAANFAMTCSLLAGMQQNSVSWNDTEANVSYKEAILGLYNDFQIRKEEFFLIRLKHILLKNILIEKKYLH